ncbi:1, 4-beta cellobiohydrolase [Coniella lustricola]|uniref:1, 4-beta cellobiohydrolase n=1 Tax=Coniella lustricola TaxID=2025994 RepID=A0A2T2ZTR4_9PEZI|nr:1, 4-beta cellobiohydrolase [Coniella lustricola]
MVTSMNVSKCSKAQSADYECVSYTTEQLNLLNVAMCLDAGHVGWLDWSASLQLATTLLAQVYKKASSPAAVRALSTNSAGFNAHFIVGQSRSGKHRYDYHCSYSDALQPAPEAGTWFEAYFEQLLTNADLASQATEW